MLLTKPITTIDFHPISLQDKSRYEALHFQEAERGCEYAFANLFLWGEQNLAFVHDHAVLFSRFHGRSFYPYPLGDGDKRAVLEAILEDAKAREIPCVLSGLRPAAVETLEALYPDLFRLESDPGFCDYVYAIDDLADLKGKKYHGKRNHLHRFEDAFPHHTVEPITEDNLPEVQEMAQSWYRERLKERPDDDFEMEQRAMQRALDHYRELDFVGLLLRNGAETLAFTLGSRLSPDTVDVHFEKARPDIQGAYPAINCAFARYIRSRFPDIRFLNREEDMGLEGLRKSKLSYHPHHRVEKYRAFLRED